jgi:hypothetical protein
MWVAIPKCMKATLGISLCSYLYLKLAKCYVFLIISYVFSSTKSENKRVEQLMPRSGVGPGGAVAQTMYAHVNKCENYKTKSSWN